MFVFIIMQAIAIIRQKPKGITSRKFTEKLLLQLSQLQEDWKAKVRSSNTYVLNVLQEWSQVR